MCVQGVTPESYIDVNSSGDLSENGASDDSADRNYPEPLSGSNSSEDEDKQRAKVARSSRPSPETKSKYLKAKKPTQDEMTNLENNMSRNTDMLT